MKPNWKPPHGPHDRDLIGANQSVVSALVRLRWFGLLAQLVTIGAVVVRWQPELPFLIMFVLLGMGVVSNLALSHWRRLCGETVLGATVVLDILLLTGLLGLSGGPANPFSVLFTVQVVLAAMITHGFWTWMAVATSSLGFGALFFANLPLPVELGGHAHGMTAGSYSAHLEGMWFAHTLAAGIIAIFVSALSRRLRQERERRERTARLLGLASLAAGAAHEIGNPLGTIRIAAGELARELSAEGIPEAKLEDLALINREVERARVVLRRLTSAAGELEGECPVPIDVGELLKSVVKSIANSDPVQLELPVENIIARWPVQALSQVVTQLLRNALQADRVGAPVNCLLQILKGGVLLEVSDRGQGMSADVLARVGEPFFTTRPGSGMGLGVFIARSLVEHLGGWLDIQSQLGEGTKVSIWLPQLEPQ